MATTLAPDISIKDKIDGLTFNQTDEDRDDRDDNIKTAFHLIIDAMDLQYENQDNEKKTQIKNQINNLYFGQTDEDRDDRAQNILSAFKICMNYIKLDNITKWKEIQNQINNAEFDQVTKEDSHEFEWHIRKSFNAIIDIFE